jgi:hypothetical protein
MGAAWSWAIGLLAYNLGPWPYVRRSLGIRGLGPDALYVLPAAAGILISASLGRVILGDSWSATLLTAVVAGVVGLIAVRQYVGPLHLAELGGFLKPGARRPLSTERDPGTTGSDLTAAMEEAG